MPITATTVDGRTITVHDHERQKVEVWSRIMGYLAVKSQWNAGKVSEWNDRKHYIPPTIPDAQPTLPID